VNELAQGLTQQRRIRAGFSLRFLCSNHCATTLHYGTRRRRHLDGEIVSKDTLWVHEWTAESGNV